MRSLLPLALVALLCFGYVFHRAGCTLLDRRPAATGYDSRPIDATQDPFQEMLPPEEATKPIPRTIEGRSVLIHPVARYRIAGRVVSLKRYYLSWDSKLAPIDFAMAWGPLATDRYDSMIRFDHGNRFYHYRYTSQIPLTPEQLVRSSANQHLIPADPLIEDTLKSVSVGETVELEGYLVNVGAVPGVERTFTWNTSLRRDDQGGGACEVVYVRKVRIGNRIFQSPQENGT